MAHITGGGFWENIPRVLPDNAKAVVKGDSWQWPTVFNWLMENGNIAEFEMYRTFNCGVGGGGGTTKFDGDRWKRCRCVVVLIVLMVTVAVMTVVGGGKDEGWW